MKKLFILIILTLVATFNILACSCGKLDKLSKNMLTDEQIAFVGRVFEVTYVDDYTMKTTFKLEENLMNLELSDTIKIWSGRDCEPHFISGEKWYIFPNLHKTKYWSGLCSRSAQLTDRIIPDNPYKKRYSRQAQRDFNKNQRRAKREIKFLRKNKS
ncbi:hypothetical protein [Marivirga sp.]|uniref:hypothetical protein n=1 Tax=Marivirga sp. TaxID=2018662 RepID=UPI002D8100B7|nr:hypothetical protein [Marivirga sp.]HET8860330.1 hypothetical protein [Marivirga sp.]